MSYFGLTSPAPNPVVTKPRGIYAPRSTPRMVSARGYGAGEITRLNQTWQSSPLTSDQVLYRELSILRARSRDSFEREPIAKKFVKMCATNIWGPNGMILMSRVVDQDGQSDPLTNKAIESAWRKWGKKRNNDIEGKLSFWSMGALIVKNMAIDGEVILRLHTTKAAPMGAALQLIDPELLDVKCNKQLENGNIVRLGVEFDSYGRAVAYHFIDVDAINRPLGYLIPTYAASSKHRRIPANQIIHAFIRERVGQTRGVPWFASAASRLQQLGMFEEAALINARVGASKMGFWKRTGGKRVFDGQEVDSTGTLYEDTAPGEFREVPSDAEMIDWNPEYPNAEMPIFCKHMLRTIAAGAGDGVAYHNLANDLESVNFASSRQGELSERDAWLTLQRVMVEEVLDPVYEWWLPIQLLLGNVSIAGQPLDPTPQDAYFEQLWLGRRWPWVDPVKDANSNIALVNARAKSLFEVIRELGKDPEAVLDEIALVQEELKKRKIEMPAVLAAVAQQPKKQDSSSSDGGPADDGGDQ